MLFGTSPNIEMMTKLISKFYCGANIRIEGEDVFNSKGKIKGVRVIQKHGRLRFESIGSK
jgi:hypothetical protein